MKLTTAVISKNKISDISVLIEIPFRFLEIDFRPDRQTEILRSINTLETINGKPVAEFWKEIEEQAKKS